MSDTPEVNSVRQLFLIDSFFILSPDNFSKQYSESSEVTILLEEELEEDTGQGPGGLLRVDPEHFPKHRHVVGIPD